MLEEVDALARVFVVKWNSLGTVAERAIFFGGGSENWKRHLNREIKQIFTFWVLKRKQVQGSLEPSVMFAH